MKRLALLICAFGVFTHIQAYGVSNHMTKSAKIQKDCAQTLGESKTESEKLKATDFQYQYKCYMKCVAEKFELLTDGSLNQAKVEDYLNRLPGVDETKMAEYKESYNKCKDIKVDDACETAYKLYECGKIVNSDLLQLLTEFITNEVNAKED